MPYTNIELVRKHLQESEQSTGQIENHLIRPDGLTAVQLPHAGIVDGSEKVKGKEQIAPARETISLAGEASSLSRGDLIAESVVIASDSSLTQIFTENIDYTVNYTSGGITRIPTGLIQSGQDVSVWYYHYKIFEKGIDYLISYQNGTITRVDGGSIEDGQMLWIDYEIESGLFSDDVITNAVVEASAQLDSRIDETLAESVISVLTIAETYLAVSILTQIRALDVLQSSSLSSANKGNVSTRFLEVSSRYRNDFEDMIRPYLRPATRLSGPVRSSR
ncbi:MAG: hypothetical protein KJ723_08485 [candidate division Zixibacteria bacterium]|nr:hypothetical protein [candidate division Zixibacteria bacterium]